jgi:hypothetical protein
VRVLAQNTVFCISRSFRIVTWSRTFRPNTPKRLLTKESPAFIGGFQVTTELIRSIRRLPGRLRLPNSSHRRLRSARNAAFLPERLRSVKSGELLTQLIELWHIIEDDIRIVRITYKKVLMIFLGGIEAI